MTVPKITYAQIEQFVHHFQPLIDNAYSLSVKDYPITNLYHGDSQFDKTFYNLNDANEILTKRQDKEKLTAHISASNWFINAANSIYMLNTLLNQTLKKHFIVIELLTNRTHQPAIKDAFKNIIDYVQTNSKIPFQQASIHTFTTTKAQPLVIETLIMATTANPLMVYTKIADDSDRMFLINYGTNTYRTIRYFTQLDDHNLPINPQQYWQHTLQADPDHPGEFIPLTAEKIKTLNTWFQNNIKLAKNMPIPSQGIINDQSYQCNNTGIIELTPNRLIQDAYRAFTYGISTNDNLAPYATQQIYDAKPDNPELASIMKYFATYI